MGSICEHSKRSGECSRRVFDSVSHHCRRHRHQHSWVRRVEFETTSCRMASLLDPISERPRRSTKAIRATGVEGSRLEARCQAERNQWPRIQKSVEGCISTQVFFDTPLTTDIYCAMAEARLLIPRKIDATAVSLANGETKGPKPGSKFIPRSAGYVLRRIN